MASEKPIQKSKSLPGGSSREAQTDEEGEVWVRHRAAAAEGGGGRINGEHTAYSRLTLAEYCGKSGFRFIKKIRSGQQAVENERLSTSLGVGTGWRQTVGILGTGV